MTAISYFNHAIDKDAGYALAYGGLADAYGVVGSLGSDLNDVKPSAWPGCWWERPGAFGL
jgi:hypothetical protein